LWLLLVPLKGQSPYPSYPRATGRRIALVVGNNDYLSLPKLHNAVNDARGMTNALRDVGFDTTELENATLEQLDGAITEFVRKLKRGDVALLYYSGHAAQINGDNYLSPVNLVVSNETQAKYRSLNAQEALDQIEATGADLKIVILDACRSNPFGQRSIGGKGLAAMNAGTGTLIAYATAPGQTADDNTAGNNGLFTTYLIQSLKVPGLSLEQVFKRTNGLVQAGSGGTQVPWIASSVNGDFYFHLGNAATDFNSFTFPTSRPRADDFAAARAITNLIDRGLSQERDGNAREAFSSFREAYERARAASDNLPPGQAPSEALEAALINADYQYAWTLFTTGNTEDASRIMFGLESRIGRSTPATAPSDWLVSYARVENLLRRYYTFEANPKQPEEGKRHYTKALEFASRAAEAPCAGFDALRFAAWLCSNPPGPLSNDLVSKVCELSQRLVAKGPSDPRAVESRVWCLQAQTQAATGPQKLTIQMQNVTAAIRTLSDALKWHPEDSYLMISLSDLQVQRADLPGGTEDLRTRARDLFLKSLRGKIVIGYEVKEQWERVRSPKLPNTQAELAYYREVLEAVKPSIEAFPQSPDLAFVAADASSRMGEYANMAGYLESLATKQGTIRFTISADFAGIKSDFNFYVREWPAEYPFLGIDDQVRWLKEARGGTIPDAIADKFRKLHKTARETNASFPELARGSN